MADTAEYLAELEARRATFAGIKSTQHQDQQTTTDLDQLDREIARVKRVLQPTSRTRLAAFHKGC